MELQFVLLQSHPLSDLLQGQGLKSLEGRVTTCDSFWKADTPIEGNH